MAEHYTRNTTGILKFCNTCNRMTMHKVSGKRVGLCTEDHHASKINAEKAIVDNKQDSLF